jgi:hypothetical protein
VDTIGPTLDGLSVRGENCYGMPKVGWREVAERNIGFSVAEPQKQSLITGLRKAGWEA